VTVSVTGVDLNDSRRATVGDGLLRALSDATVLSSADVRTSLALGRLAGGADDPVLVAIALAVRAVRLGHVYVDLSSASTTVAPDDEEVVVDLAALPWPDPTIWPALVAASQLTTVGPDGPPDRPLRLLGDRLYARCMHRTTIEGDYGLGRFEDIKIGAS
jgi:exodeoxyribonuclease V alpha subunit